MDPECDDQNSAWQAKAHWDEGTSRRSAKSRRAFRESSPYTLTPEPTENSECTDYRLRYRDFPVAISTYVGDVLHKMRAALESLAVELARRSQGETLTSSQETASTFPNCKSPDGVDKLVRGRRGLFNERAIKTLRSV